VATTDPVSLWLDRSTVAGPEAFVSKQGLVAAYNADASRDGRPWKSENAFTRILHRVRPEVEEAQRTYQGRARVHCWIGIGLVTTAAGTSGK
jgi:hypothetical protein